VARFGDRLDAQGVLAESPQAARCIGYLTKYLTKQIGTCHQSATGPESDHAARLAEALRWQPCSPRCANWLRYGIAPKNARPGLAPGACKGNAHDGDHLGYAGRRVLCSRKWSGKTLADHRADRKEWLLRTLGVSATDPARYAWELVAPSDHDHMDHARRMLHVVADRLRWQTALAGGSMKHWSPDRSAMQGSRFRWNPSVFRRLTWGNASRSIPRISRDQRQMAAVGCICLRSVTSLRCDVSGYKARSGPVFRGRSGGRGIRTHGDVAATMVFKTIAIGH
jgi:hypothetical protein